MWGLVGVCGVWMASPTGWLGSQEKGLVIGNGKRVKGLFTFLDGKSLFASYDGKSLLDGKSKNTDG